MLAQGISFLLLSLGSRKMFIKLFSKYKRKKQIFTKDVDLIIISVTVLFDKNGNEIKVFSYSPELIDTWV